MKKKANKKLVLTLETLKVLSSGEAQTAVGGVMTDPLGTTCASTVPVCPTK